MLWITRQLQFLIDETLQQGDCDTTYNHIELMGDLHLDSATFDTKKYFSTFLKNSTIKELIRKNNQIEEEIKVHDHEIQSLVFQNYSKFIASIDTVKQMKTDISKVDSKLKNLDESMDKIALLAEKIDSTFSVKRKEIQKLDTINKDLKKLKTLCEFPDVLKADLQFYRGLEKNEDKIPYKLLFENTVQYYKDCFTTLTDFKSEALVAPIYKESINKVQEVRSILWNLQNQLKARQASEQLKNITLKLMTVTQEQVSPLRTYFKKTKQKYSENCLAHQKYFPSLESEFSDKETNPEVLRANYEHKIQKAHEQGKVFLNQQFWKQFQMDFKFVFDQLFPVIRCPEEVNELIVTNCRDVIFLPILDNFCESVLRNCQSAVHFNLVMESASTYFNSLIGCISIDTLKKELTSLLKTRLEQICSTKHVITFIDLQQGVLRQLIRCKEQAHGIVPTEGLQKHIYQLMNPLKNYISANYLRVVVDLCTTNYREYYGSFKAFLDLLTQQTKQFVKFVENILSTPSNHISEQVVLTLTEGLQKTVVTASIKREIEQLVIKYKALSQNGNTFLFSHSLLTILERSLTAKILEDLYSSVRLTEDQKYSLSREIVNPLSERVKKAIFRNLSNFCLHYILLIDGTYQQKQVGQGLHFNKISAKMEQFLAVCGHIFPESRKNIPRKPSFLNTSEKSLRFDMDIMIAKKVRIFQKKEHLTRSSLLSSFLRGILKTILKLIRQRKLHNPKFEAEIYCTVQLCYQIASVDDESLVNAFYYLIREQYYKGSEVPKIEKQTLDGIFSNQRGKLTI